MAFFEGIKKIGKNNNLQNNREKRKPSIAEKRKAEKEKHIKYGQEIRKKQKGGDPKVVKKNSESLKLQFSWDLGDSGIFRWGAGLITSGYNFISGNKEVSQDSNLTSNPTTEKTQNQYSEDSVQQQAYQFNETLNKDKKVNSISNRSAKTFKNTRDYSEDLFNRSYGKVESESDNKKFLLGKNKFSNPALAEANLDTAIDFIKRNQFTITEAKNARQDLISQSVKMEADLVDFEDDSNESLEIQSEISTIKDNIEAFDDRIEELEGTLSEEDVASFARMLVEKINDPKWITRHPTYQKDPQRSKELTKDIITNSILPQLEDIGISVGIGPLFKYKINPSEQTKSSPSYDVSIGEDEFKEAYAKYEEEAREKAKLEAEEKKAATEKLRQDPKFILNNEQFSTPSQAFDNIEDAIKSTDKINTQIQALSDKGKSLNEQISIIKQEISTIEQSENTDNNPFEEQSTDSVEQNSDKKSELENQLDTISDQLSANNNDLRQLDRTKRNFFKNLLSNIQDPKWIKTAPDSNTANQELLQEINHKYKGFLDQSLVAVEYNNTLIRDKIIPQLQNSQFGLAYDKDLKKFLVTTAPSAQSYVDFDGQEQKLGGYKNINYKPFKNQNDWSTIAEQEFAYKKQLKELNSITTKGGLDTIQDVDTLVENIRSYTERALNYPTGSNPVEGQSYEEYSRMKDFQAVMKSQDFQAELAALGFAIEDNTRLNNDGKAEFSYTVKSNPGEIVAYNNKPQEDIQAEYISEDYRQIEEMLNKHVDNLQSNLNARGVYMQRLQEIKDQQTMTESEYREAEGIRREIDVLDQMMIKNDKTFEKIAYTVVSDWNNTDRPITEKENQIIENSLIPALAQFGYNVEYNDETFEYKITSTPNSSIHNRAQQYNNDKLFESSPHNQLPPNNVEEDVQVVSLESGAKESSSNISEPDFRNLSEDETAKPIDGFGFVNDIAYGGNNGPTVIERSPEIEYTEVQELDEVNEEVEFARQDLIRPNAKQMEKRVEESAELFKNVPATVEEAQIIQQFIDLNVLPFVTKKGYTDKLILADRGFVPVTESSYNASNSVKLDLPIYGIADKQAAKIIENLLNTLPLAPRRLDSLSSSNISNKETYYAGRSDDGTYSLSTMNIPPKHAVVEASPLQTKPYGDVA